MRVFAEKYAEVTYHPILKAIVVKWKDFATPEEYKKTVEFAYDEAVAHNCSNWISDMTQGKAVSIASTTWLKMEFIPRVASEGLIRKLAFLIDYNPFRKSFIDTIKESILMSGIPFRSFKDKSEMENWIKEQDYLRYDEESKNFQNTFSQFY